ncbi:MAG: hypothetical protein ABJA34_08650 [Pseudonocardiales bacterium]
MNFTVTTNDAVDNDEYSGDAAYELKDGGVLVVHHTVSYRSGNEPAGSRARSFSQITAYGPSGWLRLDESRRT